MEFDFDEYFDSLSRREPSGRFSKYPKREHSFGRVNHNSRRKSSGLLNKQNKKFKTNDSQMDCEFDSDVSKKSFVSNAKIDPFRLDVSQLNKYDRALIHEERVICDYENADSKKTIKFPYYRTMTIASRRRDIISSKSRRDRDLAT